MTQATVEKLVAKANELAQKGSWIRSGLTKWLEMWNEATSADLKDENLKRVVVMVRVPRDSISLTYYLERGHDVVFSIWDEDFDHGMWDDEERVDVDDEDMTVLRRIIRGLAPQIDKYIAELVKAGEQYDKLIMLLPPEDQHAVMLTPDYWALPRPNPDGAGWFAEIVDVESDVCMTTPILKTRDEAIKIACRMAHTT